MPILNEQQRQRAIEVMKQYLSYPPNDEGITLVDEDKELDENRIEIVEQELKPLLKNYLYGKEKLDDFKSKIDSINKRNEFWGFKGIKGQMFFNMIINVADDFEECDQEIKAAITVPTNEQIASSRIKTFGSYIKRIGDQWVEAGNTKYGRPKIGSVPYFLSYFWQIQDRDVWPVYYTNGVNTMKDLNLWQPSEDLAEDYLTFKKIHEELEKLFTEASGTKFDLYRVEHVFWFKGGNPYVAITSEDKKESQRIRKADYEHILTKEESGLLPESYVPPIIAILPRIAINDNELVKAAKKSGTSLERAFEKYIDAALTILGYESKLMGQGQGRVPDGIAFANDENYAIIWDAKIRSDKYAIGTDDRTIREYIMTQSREMKRKRMLRNIYYMIVSSRFADDYDDLIRYIKMETDINEVNLVEADALVAMVDLKLRASLQITLGPDGLQRLFSYSGILTEKMVREELI